MNLEILNFNINNIYFYLIGFGFLLLLQRIYQLVRILIITNKFAVPNDTSLLFGNWNILTQSTDQLHNSLRQFAKELYPHYKLRVFLHSGLVLLSPEDCEIFMSTKKHSTKSAIYLLLRNWLNDGLLLSEGKKWNRRRKILTPSFHFNILKTFLNVFHEETESVLKILFENGSDPLDVFALSYDYALNSITATAMGHQLDSTNQKQNEYRKSIGQLEEILIHRIFRPWIYSNICYFFSSLYWKERSLLKTLHNFTKSVIDERSKIFKSFNVNDIFNSEDREDHTDVHMNKKRRKLAMLDILLQAKANGENIDDDGIAEEVDTFMFEGHDTTTSAISFCLFLLANHSDIQELLHHEIISILGEKKRPSYEDLQNMDLLERCIKESLRLYPSVYFISRVADEDTELHSGLIVPKNSIMVFHIFGVHRNPDIYPDPEKFDPDRFLPENCQNRHPYAYIPFSAGPRNCIGQRFAMLEIKTLLVGIIQNFRMIAVDTPETVVIKIEILLRTKNGIRIKFEPR